jgi:beta-carotene 15,15'-dioxygenase
METLKTVTSSIFRTPTAVSVAAGALLLLWQQSAGQLPVLAQGIFFGVCMLLTGIPHGAIDHLVEMETAKRTRRSFYLFLFLGQYLLTMLLYGVLWYFLPTFSLVFFLLISAWHFGETDVEHAPPTGRWNVARFVFGCFVLLWLLLLHAADTTPILARISQQSSSVIAVWAWMVASGPVILAVAALLSAGLMVIAYMERPILIDRLRYLRLVLILGITALLPLLPAFALYFGGWHAICSFQSIHRYITDPTKPDFILFTWSKTLLFTAVACAFLGFAVWYWFYFLQSWDPLPLLFIFLSLITLPHLRVMHGMNSWHGAS